MFPELRGIEENPHSINPHSLKPEKQGKSDENPKTKEKNLLERFIEHKRKILKFLTDLRVPFEK
ncbi:Mobile element protein [Methanosarcina lacustris Z-7289]|uniref:Mobile element protein n=1 Tax=Methanosarcina lacustris Z-7289 TaxID=1434111 RepID=A0A0E3WSP4_9EURY|nr:Mobile element protein [Methanosarcina lacustris Z-7289]